MFFEFKKMFFVGVYVLVVGGLMKVFLCVV